MRALRANGIASRGGKVTVQSFEVTNLKALDHRLPGVPLFDAKAKQPGDVLAAEGTLTHGEMATPAGLRDVARSEHVASPRRTTSWRAGHSLAPTSFVADAHGAGRDVVAYTFRAEKSVGRSVAGARAGRSRPGPHAGSKRSLSVRFEPLTAAGALHPQVQGSVDVGHAAARELGLRRREDDDPPRRCPGRRDAAQRALRATRVALRSRAPRRPCRSR